MYTDYQDQERLEPWEQQSLSLGLAGIAVVAMCFGGILKRAAISQCGKVTIAFDRASKWDGFSSILQHREPPGFRRILLGLTLRERKQLYLEYGATISAAMWAQEFGNPFGIRVCRKNFVSPDPSDQWKADTTQLRGEGDALDVGVLLESLFKSFAPVLGELQPFVDTEAEDEAIRLLERNWMATIHVAQELNEVGSIHRDEFLKLAPRS